MATANRALSVSEVAERLGIHKQAVYRLIWGRQIGWTNVGTGNRPRIRISEQQLAAFMSERAEAA